MNQKKDEKRESIVVTDEHYHISEEMLDDWYRCPKCNKDWIVHWFKFCPSCGVQLIWRLE